MFSAFYAEIKKLEHTKILWLVIVGASPAAWMALVGLLPMKGTPAHAAAGMPTGINMQDMFYRQGMALTILGPALFGLLVGYIVSREHQERTVNQLFSYPLPRATFLVAKLAVVFLLMAVTTALSVVLVVGPTLVFKHYFDAEAVRQGVWMNALICLLSFGTIPVAAAVSMVAESVIPTAVLGAVITLIAAVMEIGHSPSAIVFPWLAPYWPVRLLAQGIANNTGPNPYAPAALVILALTFAVSLTFCIAYCARADVHSGS